MKYFPPLFLLICVAVLGLSILKTPLMKLPTEMAVEEIEDRYLRDNLTEKEKEEYDFRKKWILWNQEGSHAAYTFSLKGILIITILSALQNAILLVIRIRKRRVEPDGTGQPM